MKPNIFPLAFVFALAACSGGGGNSAGSNITPLAESANHLDESPIAAAPRVPMNALTSTSAKPIIVLVHGAWADASGFNGVISRLQEDGYTVYAPPNPLRGLTSDAAYLAGFLKTISGPIVLVGHSYGGAVITNAALGNPNIKALVFIDAFAPDEGESLLQLAGARPGSALNAPPATVFNLVPLPGGDVDLFLKADVVREDFANDLPSNEASVLASTQRPLTLSAAAAKSGTPAWKTIPSWYMIGTDDRVLPPAEQLFMAKRAHSEIVEVNASHLSMTSHPDVAEDLIVKAAHQRNAK